MTPDHLEELNPRLFEETFRPRRISSSNLDRDNEHYKIIKHRRNKIIRNEKSSDTRITRKI